MDKEMMLATVALPDWLFEQDYLIFLSLFGWLLIAFLSWANPLGGTQEPERRRRWMWFGLFGMAQAVAELAKILSFSDPFFRAFHFDPAFEMLGYGFLIDFSLRRLNRFKGTFVLPVASVAAFILGLALQPDAIVYTRILSILVGFAACVSAAKVFLNVGKSVGSWQCNIIGIGLMFSLISFLLESSSRGALSAGNFSNYSEYPYFGFSYLIARIVAAWTILSAFWGYRLLRRINEVTPQVKGQLQLWGHRVMPLALLVILVSGFFVTRWNGARVRSSMELDYVSRSQIAALPMKPSLPEGLWGEKEDRDFDFWPALEQRLQALQSIGSDVLNVYLWRGDEKGITALAGDSMRGGYLRLMESSEERLAELEGFKRGESFLLGPLVLGDTAMLNISSPVIDITTNEPAYWLGIDLSASDWLRNVAMARLQTIIIAGLLVGLTVFFLYFQIDHESEAELILAKERAEAGDHAKSEFLAVISHEIRTPLQSVLGYSDLLRSTPLNEKQQNCLDTIQSEGKILLRIVQDILDFSNLRKVNHELKLSRVNLRDLIEETYRTIKPMAEEKGLAAGLEIGDNLPDIIETDSVRLRQVLLNLFGNSVKYTESGSVKLGITCKEDTGTKSGGGDLAAINFSIVDTGVGIKEEDLGRLFEPFIQLEHTGNFAREGAGLGLAIVSRIIELMNGSIDVKSEVGVGSTFIASFHFRTYHADRKELVTKPVLEVEQEELLGHRFPLKVLVADDNPMVRNLVGQYLESLGFEPTIVDGGRPASEKGAAYDLMVMDIRMPEVDGPMAASIVREKSGHNEMPWIIGASATLAEAEIDRAMSMGVNTFLGKPFFVDALAEKILEIPWLAEFERKAKETIEVVVPSVDEALEEPKESITGGGMGVFSSELIDQAADEVVEQLSEIEKALSVGNFPFVSDKAHYIANTAMAIGIDDLYLDSKALEAASEEKDEAQCSKQLERLRVNFAAWRCG